MHLVVYNKVKLAGNCVKVGGSLVPQMMVGMKSLAWLVELVDFHEDEEEDGEKTEGEDQGPEQQQFGFAFLKQICRLINALSIKFNVL